MISHYFRTAWRNLRKHRFYAVINMIGPAVGFSCFLLLLLFVRDEFGYDAYHRHIDRLYRLNFYGKLGDQVVHTAASPMPAGPAFIAEVPGVAAFCRLKKRENTVVRNGADAFMETNVMLADSSLFQVFSFRMLEGDPRAALSAPYSAVLDQSAARKYFGEEHPVGKSLFINDEAFLVTGLMEDIPANTHFQAGLFLSMSTFKESPEDGWGGTNAYNYFLLKDGANAKQASEQACAVLARNFAPILEEALKTDWESFNKAGNYLRVELFPVKDIHLRSALDDELGANGDEKQVYMFIIIALFILALACINFMNLATARASVRAKEVGVRKAVGARRADLMRQFLGESLMTSFSALFIAWAAVGLLLPAFNRLSGKELSVGSIAEPWFLITSLLLAAVAGILAGSYPAFFLSAFQPEKVLKSGTYLGPAKSGQAGLRGALVIFQFFATTALLIGSLIVYRQLAFMREKKLGFNKENVLVIQNALSLGPQIDAFKEKALQNPAVRHVSRCSGLPALSLTNAFVVYRGRTIRQDNSFLSHNWWVDRDYVKTMGMEISEGRDFSKEMSTDSMAVIINETLAKSFGYPQKSVLGEEIGMIDGPDELEVYHVVGVVKDFNFSSLRENVEPLAIYQGGGKAYLALRFETSEADALLQNLRKIWTEMAPGKPFEYAFLDQRFEALYKSEMRLGKVVRIFAGLAIFIACTGLLGLATFMAERRRKEIGIRKVLGAGVAGITGLLAGDFLKLVLTAVLLATPVAWYFMRQWLANFAYRIDIQWWMFAAAGGAAMVIAFLTVGFQSVRAATANPVRSLNSD